MHASENQAENQAWKKGGRHFYWHYYFKHTWHNNLGKFQVQNYQSVVSISDGEK